MILIIAGATLREAARSRAFLGLLALYAVAVLLSRLIGWVSGTDGNLVTVSLIMSLQSIFGVLVAVATGTALVQTEIQQKTLYTILSRPVRRRHFVVGKFVGLAGALMIGQMAMLGMGLVYLSATGAPVTIWLVLAGVLTMCEVLVMAAVSLCWTALTSPLIAVALCLATYALGHAVGELPQLMYHLKGSQVVICSCLASLVPDLSRFVFRDFAIHDLHMTAGDALQRIAYALLWISLLVTITISVVRRKQL